jgi:hypothetical protein
VFALHMITGMSSCFKAVCFLRPLKAQKPCSHFQFWTTSCKTIWNVKPRLNNIIPSCKAPPAKCFPIVFQYVILLFIPIRTNKCPQNLYQQLLRASRQWRDLKSRMEQGLGHQPEHDIPDGAMAIFCPACPQPGINLPQDWRTKYEPYVSTRSGKTTKAHSMLYQRNQLIRTFIMDGNFSAEHMKHRTSERDIPLSPGMAFMANPETYKAHLSTGKEIDQVCV